MINVKMENGVSELSAEGTGVEILSDCMTLVVTLSKHLASQNKNLADLYEYLVTKNAKDGTLFDEKNRTTASEIFKGTLEEFLKEES